MLRWGGASDVVEELPKVIPGELLLDVSGERAVVVGVVPGDLGIEGADVAGAVVDALPKVGVDMPAVDHFFVKATHLLHQLAAHQLEVAWGVIEDPVVTEGHLIKADSLAPAVQQLNHLVWVIPRHALP